MSLIDKILARLWAPVVGMLFGIALIFFIFGIIEFMAGAASEEKRATGKRHIIWGLVGLFIMLSVWAIVRIIANFFTVS